MKRDKSLFLLAAGVVILAAVLSGGCVSAPKKALAPEPAAPQLPQVTQDVKVFRALQQIDLDNDGSKEIVAIYDTNTNVCGVKVLKDVNNQAVIIFEQVFDDPGVKFEVIKGVPKILFYQPAGDNGAKSNRSYSWDGKTFVLDPQK